MKALQSFVVTLRDSHRRQMVRTVTGCLNAEEALEKAADLYRRSIHDCQNWRAVFAYPIATGN